MSHVFPTGISTAADNCSGCLALTPPFLTSRSPGGPWDWKYISSRGKVSLDFIHGTGWRDPEALAATSPSRTLHTMLLYILAVHNPHQVVVSGGSRWHSCLCFSVLSHSLYLSQSRLPRRNAIASDARCRHSGMACSIPTGGHRTAPVLTSLASVLRYHCPSSRGNPYIGALVKAFFSWLNASYLRSVHSKSVPLVADSYKGAASSVKP